MNMEKLPPETQENVLREVINQKVEDKKRMGWGKINQFFKNKDLMSFFAFNGGQYYLVIGENNGYEIDDTDNIFAFSSSSQQYKKLLEKFKHVSEGLYVTDLNEEQQNIIQEQRKILNKIEKLINKYSEKALKLYFQLNT